MSFKIIVGLKLQQTAQPEKRGLVTARVHNKNTKGECLMGKYPAKSLRILWGAKVDKKPNAI